MEFPQLEYLRRRRCDSAGELADEQFVQSECQNNTIQDSLRRGFYDRVVHAGHECAKYLRDMIRG